MAVTRTRTRTQTALTKIAELIAEAHGKLRVLAELVEQVRLEVAGGVRRRKTSRLVPPEAVLAGIAIRRAEVGKTRDALYVTLRQFDPALDPRQVGETFEWLKAYGRGKAAVPRYRLRLDVVVTRRKSS